MTNVRTRVRYDWAVVRTDVRPHPPGDGPHFDDARVITKGEGSRHNAVGRAACLNREAEEPVYEPRSYLRPQGQVIY